jgi:hypothetical protein
MTKKMIDCRAVPNDLGRTLALTGEPGELVTAALSIRPPGTGTPTPPSCASSCTACWPASRPSRSRERSSSSSSSRLNASGSGTRSGTAGPPRPARAVRGCGGVPRYAAAAFLKELQSICRAEPEFRNLDMRSVQA